MTRRGAVTVLLQIPQLIVKLERLLLVDALRMQQRYTAIRVTVLQLLPAILRPPHVANALRADCFGAAGRSLTLALGIASTSIALQEIPERGNGRAYTPDTGFDIRAQHDVGHPDCFGSSARVVQE